MSKPIDCRRCGDHSEQLCVHVGVPAFIPLALSVRKVLTMALTSFIAAAPVRSASVLETKEEWTRMLNGLFKKNANGLKAPRLGSRIVFKDSIAICTGFAESDRPVLEPGTQTQRVVDGKPQFYSTTEWTVVANGDDAAESFVYTNICGSMFAREGEPTLTPDADGNVDFIPLIEYRECQRANELMPTYKGM